MAGSVTRLPGCRSTREVHGSGHHTQRRAVQKPGGSAAGARRPYRDTEDPMPRRIPFLRGVDGSVFAVPYGMTSPPSARRIWAIPVPSCHLSAPGPSVSACWIWSGAEALVPSKRNRTAARAHDRDMHGWRRPVENFFERTGEFRATATRHHRTDGSFAAGIPPSPAWSPQDGCQQMP